MSWIEGVGDEVTITVAAIAVLAIILVAWISTGIRDIPFIRVVVVQLTRRRRQPQTDSAVERIEAELLVRQPENVLETDDTSGDNVAEPVVAQSENSVDSREDDEVNPGDDNASAKSLEANVEQKTEDNNKDIADENTALEDEEDIVPVDVENLSASELRQRRVEFFKGPTQPSSVTDNGIQDAEQSVHVVNKANESNETEEKLETSDEKGKESETETKSLKSKRLSDLASNLLNEELENSRKEQTDSRNSQTETRGNENQSTGTGSETPDEIRVRLKYLNDTQRLVTASPSETIGNFRR